MECEIFNYNNIKLKYSKLLIMLEDGSFKEKYPSFQIMNSMNCFIINDDPEFLIIIFNKKIEVIIEFKGVNRVQEKFKINSSLDLENICKEKKITLDSLYIPKQNGSMDHYEKKSPFLIIRNIIDNKITLISQQKESLPKMNEITNFKEGISYKIRQYSSFYEDYFGDINPDSEFKYIESKTRREIFVNMLMLNSPGIKKFQITGPYSIGKSITLLYFCRMTRNSFYLNLKIISNKPRKESFSILMEEFSNVDKNLYPQIQEILNNNYFQDLTYMEAIVNIINFFSSNQIRAIFVFDQHKKKYYLKQEFLYDKIINSKECIKLVFCSSINDHNIRDECCKAWNSFIWTNEIGLNENTQEYYFYYDKLYEKTNDKNDKLAKKFNGLSKYMKYYKDLKHNNIIQEEEIDNFVIKKTISKIEEFIAGKKITLDFALINMKNMINRKYEMSELNNIIKWFPLKYFVVQFKENGTFKIKMLFPFLKKIINKTLDIKEIDSFFAEKKYLKTSIENDKVKGDYFESSVKIGLKNNIKLPAEINSEVVLEEIVTMTTKEENSDDDDNDDSYDIKNGDEDNSSEDMSIEKEQIDIEDDFMDTSSLDEEDSNNKEIKMEDLLNKFSIDLKKKIRGDDDIEFYRRKVIKEIERLLKKKKEIKFPKTKYNGNKNYFIDQKKKTGKMLDYALLFGLQKEKIFVGFQFKCYFNKTKTIKDKFINKTKIKNECQKILFNSMTLFDCKITQWYYFLIFYYNPKKSEYNANSLILSKCKDVIGILFYDPIQKKFYDNNYKPLYSLELNHISDLDYCYSYYQMDIMDFNKIPKLGEIYNNIQLKDSFLKDFSFMKSNDIETILKKIAEIMKINCNLRLLHKNKYLSSFSIPPLKNRLILYKKKYKGFIGVKSVYQGSTFINIECFDLNNGELIEDLSSEIDKKFDYLYTLSMTRNYNQVKSGF
jgi:hypothetical protein